MKRSSAVLVIALAACARTGILDFDGDDDSGEDDGTGGTGGVLPECTTTAECVVNDPCAPPTCRLDGTGPNATMRCIATLTDCSDADPCTNDSCEPASGACLHERPMDADGDGFLAVPSPDGSVTCGVPDCDDTDPNVHPGAVEACDGRDNDCNDGIDDGFEYTAVELAPLPISPLERGRATHGGLVWNGESYAVSYNTTTSHKQSYFKLLTSGGTDASREVEISRINADAFAGPIEWSGSSFFTAFSDARQGGNYEVYAARFRSDGLKLQGGDIRLTDAPDFSLNPTVVWMGEAYVVAWDDRRGRADGGFPQIFARRFTEAGEPIGDEVLISPPGEWGESPALAVGESTLGFTYVSLDDEGISRARFRTLDLTLGGAAAAVELPLSRFAIAPSIAFAGGRFLVAWAFSLDATLPGAAVHVAAVDEATYAVSGGHPATFGFSFARGPTLVSLGDRAFLAFSGAGSDGAYELYSTIVPASLATPGAATRLTFTPALSLFPYAARGPEGSIGIVFDEDDQAPPTSRRPYLMSVGCDPPIIP